MKVARSAALLLEQLDTDLSWRLKEIISLRKVIDISSGVSRTTVLRASVPILYAHWEGYVKAAAISYCGYLSSLNLNFSDTQKSFSGLKALGYVQQLHAIRRKIFVASELLDALQNIESEKVELPVARYVSNIGNLNFELFEEISRFLSIDPSSYATKKNLIDEILLKQRNEIAHGTYLSIDADSFKELSENILNIMRDFKTDIQNAVASKAFRRT